MCDHFLFKNFIFFPIIHPSTNPLTIIPPPFQQLSLHAGLLLGQVLRAGAPAGVRQQAQPLQASQAALRPRQYAIPLCIIILYYISILNYISMSCVGQQQAPPPFFPLL